MTTIYTLRKPNMSSVIPNKQRRATYLNNLIDVQNTTLLVRASTACWCASHPSCPANALALRPPASSSPSSRALDQHRLHAQPVLHDVHPHRRLEQIQHVLHPPSSLHRVVIQRPVPRSFCHGRAVVRLCQRRGEEIQRQNSRFRCHIFSAREPAWHSNCATNGVFHADASRQKEWIECAGY